LVADGHKFNSTTSNSGFLVGSAIDEINNIIYILDANGPRILKYVNGSQSGTAIFDGNPKEMFSDTQSPQIGVASILVDKTGYILTGENDRVRMWTPDGKLNVTVLKEYHTSQNNEEHVIYAPTMTFDRLGNLYVYDGRTRSVVKFNRTTTTCINNIS
jgi:hypothetical protein